MNYLNFKSIYILRFFAALIVVFYHFAPNNIFDIDFSFIKKYGYEPVNFFFFLSGFILTHAYFGKIDSSRMYKIYLFKRLSKIFPLYVLSLFLTCLVNFEIFNQTGSFFSRLILEITMLQSFFLKNSLNYPDWSLSCELIFYITFPYFLKTISKLNTIKNIIYTVILYVILTITFIILNKRILNFQYFPFTHISTFVIGILSYKLLILNEFNSKAKKFLIVLICVILFYLVFHKKLFILPDHNNGWFTPFYFILIPALITNKFVSNLLSNRFFLLLGKASYSLYIFQLTTYL